uniref:Uncharacterized protein n=1 Tax=Ovis aries TaxID=9940 RepID=A0AC11DFE2_SHEEP
MPKNVQITVQFYSSPMLAKQFPKFSKPGFNSARTKNFQMLKLDLEKAEKPEIKLPTSVGSSKILREFQKNIAKHLTMWITTNWKILQEMGIPDHLTCLLRNLRSGSNSQFQIGKLVCQGCTLSPCLFNFYAEYIMRNAGLDEEQTGIKIAGRNISYRRYADDTTLIAESEELKSLLMKVKEESDKVGLKLKIQKTKIMAAGPIT